MRTPGRADARPGVALIIALPSDWWERAGADPALAPLVAQRHAIYPTGHSPEWNPPVSWHLAAPTAAGFSEVGTVWRGGPDAAVAAVR